VEDDVPELPEVETMVRGLRPVVEGRKIEKFLRCRCRCKPISASPTFPTISKKVRGCKITAVRRIAKRVVLDLDNDHSMVIEPRMTGLMLLTDPPDTEHLRFEWKLAGRGATKSFWFWDRRGLGTLSLLSSAEIQTKLGPAKLGPDALLMTVNEWGKMCEKTSRPIKVAMMVQKFVAGIGNLYASEILHRAKIHPETPAKSLKKKHTAKLQKFTLEILTEAIRYEGSTLGDGTYRNALNEAGGYQNAHRVYARAGKVCTSCQQTEILRIVQCQRSTFYCPACQPPV